MISDIRCETGDAGLALEGVTAYPSVARAREAGDIVAIAERVSAFDDVRGDDGEQVTPCATWVPGTMGELEALTGLIAAGPRWRGLVRCVPSDHGGAVVLSPWLIGDLAAALGDLRRPLLVDLQDGTAPPYQALHDLAVAFPTLPLILGLNGVYHLPLLLPLGRACPRLLVETSGLGSMADLLALVEWLGAGRVVYGSGNRASLTEMPAVTVGKISTELPEANAQAILYENTEALVDGEWASA